MSLPFLAPPVSARGAGGPLTRAAAPGPTGAGAGSEQDPPAVEEAEPLVPGDPDWRDWAGLPEDLLVKVAEKFVALHDATYEGFMRGHVPDEDLSDEEYEETIQEGLENRKGKSPSRGLFIFAMVCKAWRAAQLKVGGKLCTLVLSDVFLADWEPGTYRLPGYEAPREIVKWALKNGCPRKNTGRVDGYILRGSSHLACIAMELGDLQMVKWLCTKQGCPVDGDLRVSAHAARHGPCMLWDLKEGRIMEYVSGRIDFEELLILSKEDYEGLL